MTRTFSVRDRKDIRHLDKGDPYFEYRKYPTPTECPGCGLIFAAGRWAIKTADRPAMHREMCPACRLIRDDLPRGIAVFEGGFLNESSKVDLKNIIRNVEKKVREQRPLQRIMKMDEANGKVTVWATYDHLARRIAHAVHKALKGELTIQQTAGERLARIHWHRDA